MKALAARQPVDRTVFADPRTPLVLEPLRWAVEAIDLGRPCRAIVLEQVPAVLPVWEAYADMLRLEGYSVATGVLAAEQYGLPQTRKRAGLIARLDGDATLPAPTHRPYRKGVPQADGDPGLKPWRSMGDVLPHRGDFTVISNYGTGGDPRNRGRRTSGEPAFTVTGKISRLRLIDPDGRELPRLTPSEAGVLQGMPADWPWTGGDIAQQIGNLCPVELAAALAQAALGERLAVAA
ncbi:DNA cytosine methyltransferase [Streptomyces sp. SAS_275]|uniref:DNA cytosine methyltransferase n=1 Tax=Streptomyces sp. SAS_275 TaxID=3412746 RepID=UPI00403C4ACE